MSKALTKLTIGGSELPTGPLVSYVYDSSAVKKMTVYKCATDGNVESYSFPEFPPQSLAFNPVWVAAKNLYATGILEYIAAQMANTSDLYRTSAGWFYGGAPVLNSSTVTSQHVVVDYTTNAISYLMYGTTKTNEPNYSGAEPSKCILVGNDVQCYGIIGLRNTLLVKTNMAIGGNSYGTQMGILDIPTPVNKIYSILNNTTGLVRISHGVKQTAWASEALPLTDEYLNLTMPAGGTIIKISKFTTPAPTDLSDYDVEGMYYLVKDGSNRLYLYAYKPARAGRTNVNIGHSHSSGLVTELTGTFDNSQEIELMGLFLP